MLTYLRNVALGILLGLLFGCTLGSISKAHARDSGQFIDNDDYRSRWFRSLQQPDNPNASCCGEADSYYCDELHVRDGKNYCTISDDRDDAKMDRPHIDNGTEIEIPDNKLMTAEQIHGTNPTGHAVIFMGRYGTVYCYVMNGGV